MASPVASVTPSRTSGVAPLAVFFDATGTTDADTSKPFHDLLYTWNFGDDSSQTWDNGANTSQSKNFAVGGVAAHVYETPGTYTWTMLVSDGTTTDEVTGTITVSDPDTVYSTTNTVCVSTSGDFTGAPAGCTQVTSSDFDAALSANIGTGKRILFRRGETFTASTSVSVTADGPWTIGAFGNGTELAYVTTPQTAGAILNIGAGAGVFPDDGRIMDFDITQSAGTDTTSVFLNGNFDKLTLLRLNIHDIGDGPQFYAGQVNVVGNDHIWDSLAIVDCTIQGIRGGGATHGIYGMASKLMILGNLIDDSVGSEHLIRLDYAYKCVIQNNTLSNGASAKESIGVRGVGQDAGDAYYFQYVLPTPSPTQYVVISGNRVAVNAFASVKVGPVNDVTNTTITDVIIERNWHYIPVAPLSIVNNLMIFQGTNITERNDILDWSNATRQDGIYLLGASTGMAAATGIEIYNNTQYASTNGTGNLTLALGSTGTTGTYKNNLAYFPAETGSVTITVTGTWTASNNSTGPQTTGTNPFSSLNASEPSGFIISEASYAANGGTAQFPAQKADFYVGRDKSGDNRMGALVQNGQAQRKGVAA